MSQQEKTLIKITERFYVPGVEKMINDRAEHQRHLARAHAQSLAERQLPPDQGGGTIDDYFGSTSGAFNAVMAEADTLIGASICIAEGKEVIDQVNEEKSHLDQKLAEERMEFINAKASRDRMPKHDTERRTILKTQIAVALISGGEMIFNAFAFSFFTENLFFALFLSLGFWLALHGAANALPWVINQAQSRKGKIAIAVMCLAFFSGLFFWLGTLRVDYATEAGSAWNSVSALGFMFLNVFLFSVCVFLIHHFLPNKQVRREIKERAQWEDKVTALEASIKTLEDRKLAIEQEKKEKLGFILKRMAYSKQIENLIREKYMEVFEVFKQESILRLRRMAPCLQQTPKALVGFAPEFAATPIEKEAVA